MFLDYDGKIIEITHYKEISELIKEKPSQENHIINQLLNDNELLKKLFYNSEFLCHFFQTYRVFKKNGSLMAEPILNRESGKKLIAKILGDAALCSHFFDSTKTFDCFFNELFPEFKAQAYSLLFSRFELIKNMVKSKSLLDFNEEFAPLLRNIRTDLTYRLLLFYRDCLECNQITYYDIHNTGVPRYYKLSDQQLINYLTKNIKLSDVINVSVLKQLNILINQQLLRANEYTEAADMQIINEISMLNATLIKLLEELIKKAKEAILPEDIEFDISNQTRLSLTSYFSDDNIANGKLFNEKLEELAKIIKEKKTSLRYLSIKEVGRHFLLYKKSQRNELKKCIPEELYSAVKKYAGNLEKESSIDMTLYRFMP